MDAFISDTLIRSQHLSNHNYVTYHLDTTTSHDSHVVSVTVEMLSLRVSIAPGHTYLQHVENSLQVHWRLTNPFLAIASRTEPRSDRHCQTYWLINVDSEMIHLFAGAPNT